MGLLLSVLVVCVGVIEALSCYDHFQYGVLNCAVTAYKNTRRRSSLLLKYTSRRLGLLSEDPVIKNDEESGQQELFGLGNRLKTYKTPSQPSEPHRDVDVQEAARGGEKKLGKEDKAAIIKKLFEDSSRPKRPKPMRFISCPGLLCTEKDVELTNIINTLASEPTKEVEDSNPEVLTKEFDKLFDEYEQSGQDVLKDNTNLFCDIFEESDLEMEIESEQLEETKEGELKEKKFPENEIINSEKEVATASYQDTAAVDFHKLITSEINKSTSVDVESSDFSKTCTHPPTSDSFPIKSSILNESTASNKLADKIFENETNLNFEFRNDDNFQEIHKPPLPSEEVHEEIKKEDSIASNAEIEETEKVERRRISNNLPNLDTPREDLSPMITIGNGKSTDEEVFLKAVGQLADLIVAKSLNLKEIQSMIIFNSFPSASTDDDSKGGVQPEKKICSSKTSDFDSPTMKNNKRKCETTDCSTKTLQRNQTMKDEQEKAANEEKTAEFSFTSSLVDGPNFPGCVTTAEFHSPANVPSNFENKFETENSESVGRTLESYKSYLESLGKEKQMHTTVGIETSQDFCASTTQNILEAAPGAEPEDEEIQEIMSGLNEGEKSGGQKTNNCVFPDKRQTPDSSIAIDEIGCAVKIPEEMVYEHSMEPTKTSADEAQKNRKNPTTHGIFTAEDITKPEVTLALEYKKGAPIEHEEVIPVKGKTEQNPNEVLPEPVVVLQEHSVESQEKVKIPEENANDRKALNCEKSGTDSDSGNPQGGSLESGANFLETEELKSLPDLNTAKVSESSLEDEKSSKSNSAEDCTHGKVLSVPENDHQEATSSAVEAFWLIFSGEYTKAMSKDWHSGHFSCWQCDEALTGQRYVLRDDHPYCIKCYESVFANVCEECNKIIGIDSKDLSYKDKHWHEACFLCNKCRVSLVDKQFGSKAEKIYCGNCYDAQFASRCDGCGEIFRAGTKKMEYKTRQWHEKCFCCCVCKTPIGTKSFIPREQEIYCATCYEEKFATRCVKCNKIITSGGVTYKNEPWHRECFTCTSCNTSLAGQRFTSRDEKPYCADCFGELFAKRCTACSRPITGIGGTRFISFENRHWHNDCFICASCKTSLVGRGFITDGDDIICPECAKQKLM